MTSASTATHIPLDVVEPEAQPEAEVTTAYWVQADAITAGPVVDASEPEAEL